MNKKYFFNQNIFMIKLNFFQKFFIYGIIGLFLEVLWTGFNSLLSLDYTLMGHSSIIMLPIYGLTVFLEPLFEKLKKYSLVYRGIIYSVLILSCEFITGYILKSFNICPWDYTNKGINIMGIIRIDYMPLWFCAGLFFERIYTEFLCISLNAKEYN